MEIGQERDSCGNKKNREDGQKVIMAFEFFKTIGMCVGTLNRIEVDSELTFKTPFQLSLPLLEKPTRLAVMLSHHVMYEVISHVMLIDGLHLHPVSRCRRSEIDSNRQSDILSPFPAPRCLCNVNQES